MQCRAFLKVKLVVKVNNGGFIGCQRVGKWSLNKDYITSEYCCQQGERKGEPSFMERLCPEAPAMSALPHRSRGVAEGKNNF